LISDVLSNSFNVIVKALTYTFLVLVFLLVIDYQLVLWFMLGLTVLIIFSGALRGKTSKLNKQYAEEKAKLSQVSEEIFSNIRTVKAFHNEPQEIAKYREINRRV